jgi:chromosome condensin MukBEF MukE localization factor
VKDLLKAKEEELNQTLDEVSLKALARVDRLFQESKVLRQVAQRAGGKVSLEQRLQETVREALEVKIRTVIDREGFDKAV